jgi:hypothetical protein
MNLHFCSDCSTRLDLRLDVDVAGVDTFHLFLWNACSDCQRHLVSALRSERVRRSSYGVGSLVIDEGRLPK